MLVIIFSSTVQYSKSGPYHKSINVQLSDLLYHWCLLVLNSVLMCNVVCWSCATAMGWEEEAQWITVGCF